MTLVPEVPQLVQLPPASSSLRTQAQGASADASKVSHTEATPPEDEERPQAAGGSDWGAPVLHLLPPRPETGHPCWCLIPHPQSL